MQFYCHSLGPQVHLTAIDFECETSMAEGNRFQLLPSARDRGTRVGNDDIGQYYVDDESLVLTDTRNFNLLQKTVVLISVRGSDHILVLSGFISMLT